MKKISGAKILKFLFIFLFILVLCRASLFRQINPFGISVSFAMLAQNFDPLIIILSYVASNILLRFSINNIIIILVEACSMILLSIIIKKRKKKLPAYIISLFILFSQSARIYFGAGYFEEFLAVITSVFISFVSFYIFNISVSSFIKRGRIFKFTIDEKICHAMLTMAFFSGLSGLYCGNFILTNTLSLIILFFISRVSSPSFSICFSSIAGLGVSLSSGSIVPLALFSVWSTMFITFKSNKKIITSLMLIASDVVVGVFLNIYGFYDLWVMLSTIVGVLTVCVIPDKKLSVLSAILGKKIDMARDFVNYRSEKSLNEKLKSIANVFFELENVYRSLLLGEMDKNKAIQYLSHQCIQKSCNGCEKYKDCHMRQIDMKSAFETLAHCAVGKQKVTLLDIPNAINSNCRRVSSVIGNMNSEILNLTLIDEANKDKDKSNMLIASQLSATGRLIKGIVSNFDSNLQIDFAKSSDIYEELLFNDILVNDCACVISKTGIDHVAISVPNEQVVNPHILLCLKKVLKLKFKITERVMASIAGYTILVAKPNSNLAFTCGVATSSKQRSEECGDGYSIVRMEGEKYYCAIADGMGSGNKAHTLSTATISLIENYYKAGFDSDTIIESVNNIMLPASDDNFSTLDSVIIDTNNGRVDFIKIGASVSIIKGALESRVIECESLPLGIAENIKPTTKSDYVSGGDMIILASDGVVDGFSSIDAFLHFVNNERITNVQLLAENILEEARARNIERPDDMTVLAIKLVNNA